MEFLPVDIQQYAEQFTSAEPAHLQDLNRETWLKVLYPRMLSGHLQGRILSFFAKMLRPSRVLEVGTYTGYSAICFAEGLAPGGKLTTIDIDPELEVYIKPAIEKAGFSDRIEFIAGNAVDIIPTLEGTFDLVFLDADKENYTNYYKLVLPKPRSGGVILADNVLWSGKVLDETVQDKETKGLREFVKFVQQDTSVDHVLLPVRDGIMMVMKK